MSLRYFHILFISLSALLLLGFSGWVFFVADGDAEPGRNILGGLGALAGAGLLVYLAWFIRKSKKLP